MKLQYAGEERIPADPDTVWTFVTDPEKVGRCFPDVTDVTVEDPTHFVATVKVGVGPVRGSFKMKVELLPAASRRRIDMKISGGGFGSAVDLTSGADLVDAGDGQVPLIAGQRQPCADADLEHPPSPAVDDLDCVLAARLGDGTEGEVVDRRPAPIRMTH